MISNIGIWLGELKKMKNKIKVEKFI